MVKDVTNSVMKIGSGMASDAKLRRVVIFSLLLLYHRTLVRCMHSRRAIRVVKNKYRVYEHSYSLLFPV